MKLDNYTCLKAKIAVYIPSTVDVNKNDSGKSEKWIDDFSILFSDLFGGCTAQKAVGNWVSDKCGLVKEDVTIIYAFSDHETIEKYLDWILTAVKNMCFDMSQDCISLEYNNNLYFIDRD